MNLIFCSIVVLLDIVVHGEAAILDDLPIEKYSKLDIGIDKTIPKHDIPVPVKTLPPVPYPPVEKPSLPPVKPPIIPPNPVYYSLAIDKKPYYEDSYEKPSYPREVPKKISDGPSKSLSIESYHKISAEGLIPKLDIGDIISKKLAFKEDLLHKKEELINNLFKHSKERSGESYYKGSKYDKIEKPHFEIGDIIAKKEAFKEGLIDKISKHDNDKSDNSYYQESKYDHKAKSSLDVGDVIAKKEAYKEDLIDKISKHDIDKSDNSYYQESKYDYKPKPSLDIGDIIAKKEAFKEGLIDKISNHGKDIGGIIAKKEAIKESLINKISKHSIQKSEESKYDNSGKHSLDIGDIIAKKEAFKEGVINKISKNGFGKDISIEVSHKISKHGKENKDENPYVVPKLY